MDIARIGAILADSGGQADVSQPSPEGYEVFNFFVVAVAIRTEKAHEHAAEMIELLRKWPSESWGQPVPPLGEEINYLTAGGVLDDQLRALVLFAFGKVLGWWEILDPHTMLGIAYDDPDGRRIAGAGLVAIQGYNPQVA